MHDWPNIHFTCKLRGIKNALASLTGAYFWFLKKQEYCGKILFNLPVYLQEMLAKLKLFVIDVFISPNCKTIDKL